MGNQMACLWGGDAGRKKKKRAAVAGGGLRRRGDWENGVIEQQALAMALQQQHKAQLRLERSLANRDPSIAAVTPPRKSYHGRTNGDVMPPRKSYHGRTNGESKAEFKRSSSSRFRHIDDLLVDPRQLLNGSKVSFPAFPSFLHTRAIVHFLSSMQLPPV
jgi:hypothetical protein